MKKAPPKNKSKGAAPENKALPPAPENKDRDFKSQISVYLRDDDIAWLGAEAEKHFRGGISNQLSYLIAQARGHANA